VARWRVVMTDFTEPGHDIETAVFAGSGLAVDLVGPEHAREVGLADAVAGADALLVQFATIDRDLIDSLTSCRVISRYGIGVDMIDLVAAGQRGVPVANVPDFCIDEVSTQTIGFLVDLNRSTWAQNQHVRAGRWGQPPPCPAPRRLAGQVLGVVGLGAIGREVARKAQALGLRVLGHDPYVAGGAISGVTLVDLDTLLHTSDYVSLHCPLTDDTRGLVGAAQLAAMKPSAYLLNLSRGPVVVQGDLVDALRSGTIAGAALDVLEIEPPARDDSLLAMDNVILTPHSSSWSVESGRQLRHDAAENVVAVLRGGQARSVVNRAHLPS
jgi:D-3-phosphoglycerate dehydrogenase / 2-oxoglutarate reductase